MMSKVIIENGESAIILTPENAFETDILEKVYQKKDSYTVHTLVDAKYYDGSYMGHRLEISIKEVRP